MFDNYFECVVANINVEFKAIGGGGKPCFIHVDLIL